MNTLFNKNFDLDSINGSANYSTGFDKDITITLNILSQSTETDSVSDPDSYILLKQIIFHNVWLVKIDSSDFKYESTDIIFKNATFSYDYIEEVDKV